MSIFDIIKKKQGRIIIAFLLLLCIVLGTVMGCTTKNDDKDSTDVAVYPDFREIWKTESFDEFLKLTVTDSDGEMSLSELLSELEAQPAKYSVIDLNRDEKSEMVLWLSRSTDDFYGFLVLNYENEKVYPHFFYYRAFNELKKDGSFSFSSGVSNHGIGRIDFSDGIVTHEKVAYCESYDNKIIHYYIDGKIVSKDEFNSYISEQSKKENAIWYNLIDKMTSRGQASR